LQPFVFAAWWDQLQALSKASKGSLTVAEPEVSGSLSCGDVLHLQT
jgi:hypothetical protein